MRLTIDDQPRDLIPIKDFRAAHNLPPDFGVAQFEPKDYSGLGRIDRAGAELNGVRTAMLDALPDQMPGRGWLAFLPEYARLFEENLYAINAQVGLKDVEIEFAVAGLSDVLNNFAYALIRGLIPPPDFRQVYTDWLNNSLKVFSQTYSYVYQNETWEIQIFAHAYGRAGLVARTSEGTNYISDPALGCPAEGFMTALLSEIAAKMLAAST